MVNPAQLFRLLQRRKSKLIYNLFEDFVNFSTVQMLYSYCSDIPTDGLINITEEEIRKIQQV